MLNKKLKMNIRRENKTKKNWNIKSVTIKLLNTKTRRPPAVAENNFTKVKEQKRNK